MRVLCFVLLLHLVAAQTSFGTSYLKNSKLCTQWNCLNGKLGLPDTLPPKERYAAALKSLLPEGPWQDAVAPTLDVCYGARPRRYTNTCPGQALMQCAVEQLIQNCPEGSLQKEDACAPVSSLAGFKYLFSQSRYENLEKNLPTERRPPWFLTNYFNVKCCNLPELFNSSVLSECKVDYFMHYHLHSPQPAKFPVLLQFQHTTTPKNEKEIIKIAELLKLQVPKTTMPTTSEGNILKIANIENVQTEISQDPLDCCDMTGFVKPTWRSECDFQLSWGGQQRLLIKDQGQTYTTAAPTTTTTKRSIKHNDIKIVPQSCDEENCIFKKLNIVSESGVVDRDAFLKLLDNMTSVHTTWTKAKARVVTKCLSRPSNDYEYDCEINKVLACTLDVLSENCPYAKKADPCKHSSVLREDVSCQISASKLRPKNRRLFCGIPSFVDHEVLSQCNVKSVTRMEYVADPPATRSTQQSWLTPKPGMCKETTVSTQCMMSKMDVLNKYGFMDYFKMKDRIRLFAESGIEWASLRDVYMTAFMSTPAFYREHCNSPKKFLNVIDSMLMTCPASRRKNSPQCNKIFIEVSSLPMEGKQNMTKERANQILQYLQRIFLHKTPRNQHHPFFLHSKITDLKPKMAVPSSKTRNEDMASNPFAFGILDSKNAPPVKMVKIKPAVLYKKPLVLLPVYRRLSNGRPGKFNFALKPYGDGVFRNSPSMLRNSFKAPIGL